MTEDSAITSVDDLFAEGANYVVGVQRNTTGDIYATQDIEDAGLAPSTGTARLLTPCRPWCPAKWTA